MDQALSWDGSRTVENGAVTRKRGLECSGWSTAKEKREETEGVAGVTQDPTPLLEGAQ